MPVFIDDSKRLGTGRSRRLVSQAIGHLRAGNEHLAVLTNGRHWRLLFAGLDYEAWCDWDIDLWFEDGELSDQITALRTLLSARVWTPETDGAPPALLQAIRDARKGQAELSEVLGERVREAVEILIRGHGEALTNLATHERNGTVAPAEIYRAGCRVAMRLVVILFAESRELLPRENAIYDGSYGLNGLLGRLERDASQNRPLRDSHSAWPQVLALFRLVREGSHHPELPVTRYGGELFAPGREDEGDGLSRALYVLENASLTASVLPDADVYEMLKLLTRTTVRIRQGRGSVRTMMPVDFTGLSSDYIGILYEGLLDYELKTAPADDPVVFLATGSQPALPLSRLEAMDANALKALFDSVKGDSSDEPSDTSESAASAEQGTYPTSEGAQAQDHMPLPEAADARAEYVAQVDERHAHRQRAERWARDAVEAAGLVRTRSKARPERQMRLYEEVSRKAQGLIARIVLPGEWYLVRWGGTRKGSGTFYTRPGLAIPTVQRTLRPLAYDPPKQSDGSPIADAPAALWTPKLPERILELKVCDPACGSGSFPLAALRFLTDAVYASLQHHGHIKGGADSSLLRLLGVSEGGAETLGQERIPVPPDDDEFEAKTKAVLRRHVVERCIYAVDLDPLAVELCRLSLWIETMDRSLPFGFLDHKIKCGNALIGAWFDEFSHYPAMAWKNREGGDKNHSNGVHFEKNARTKAIKRFTDETLKPDLELALRGQDLLQADVLHHATETHAKAASVLNAMHGLPVHETDERARRYREELLASTAWSSLTQAMDLWTACWFWPPEEVDSAPLPRRFATPSEETRAVSRRIATAMRFFHWELEFPDVFRQGNESTAGFDAILGNPPWDIAKPASHEFFSNIDPLYRSYGKQEALRAQREYFDDESIERDWLDYQARFRAQSNYVSHAGNPFGDPGLNDNSRARFAVARGRANQDLHERWRSIRSRATGFADPDHPYRHQGSADLNLYKLFLERAFALVRPQGRLGLLVPSGLYSDHGTRRLRTLLMDHCRWEWLFGIENRERVFPIDTRQKFNPIIVQKGGHTNAISTAFMRRKLEDWERAEALATPYSVDQVKRLSPASYAILEIQSARDLEILEKVYRNGVPLGKDGPEGWGIRYATEFHMTNDSRLFPPRPEWEARGYRADEYSRWLLGDWRGMDELWDMLGIDPTKPVPAEVELEDWLYSTNAGPERREAHVRLVHGHFLKSGDLAKTHWTLRCAKPPYDRLPVPRVRIPAGIVLSRAADAWIREDRIEDTALPLYEGRMLGPLDGCQKGWVSGKGRTAVWRDIPWHQKQVEPQYLMRQTDYLEAKKAILQHKIAYMRISSSTNSRSTIATCLGMHPAGDSVFFFVVREAAAETGLILSSVFSTFVFDMVVRFRLGGLNMSEFVMVDAVLPKRNPHCAAAVLETAVQLSSNAPATLPPNGIPGAWPKVRMSAITRRTRTEKVATLNAIVACWLDLDSHDLRYALRSCDLARDQIAGDAHPKGFWRIGRNLDPELRETVLTQVAFDDLQQEIRAAGDTAKGLDRFLSLNGGYGWTAPESLRLADYDLGHGERAVEEHPVAQRLGPRFLDWQLAQTQEEAERESQLHTRNLLGADGYHEFMTNGRSTIRSLAPRGSHHQPDSQLRLSAEPEPPQP